MPSEEHLRNVLEKSSWLKSPSLQIISASFSMLNILRDDASTSCWWDCRQLSETPFKKQEVCGFVHSTQVTEDNQSLGLKWIRNSIRACMLCNCCDAVYAISLNFYLFCLCCEKQLLLIQVLRRKRNKVARY